MGNSSANSGAPPMERRNNLDLRDLFDSAYALIEPFFDPAAGWGGRALEHLAAGVLRQNFPRLSAEEIHRVVVAAHRIYIERNPGGSDHLPRPEDIRRL